MNVDSNGKPAPLQAIRFGIGIKLGVLLSLFAVLASGLTGYYAFSQGRDLLVRSAETELLTASQVLGRRFSILMADVVIDVRQLASMRAVREVFDPSEARREDARSRLAENFAAMLRLNPQYFQVRLIGVEHNGLELVRVDRDEHGLSQVMGPDLQEKSQFAYVYETRQLAAGEIFQSRIGVNHEIGVHKGQGQATMILATPIYLESGGVKGVLVVNVDLDSFFSVLQKDLPTNIQVFLSNATGDFLIHPDSSREFGFDYGRRYLMQHSFPETVSLFQGGDAPVLIRIVPSKMARALRENPTLPPKGAVGSFIRLPFGVHAPQRFVVLGLVIPLQDILAGTRGLAWNIVQIVVAFSILAVAVALVTSRAVTRPLQRMVMAVRQFSGERGIDPLEIRKRDEIGQLAQSFNEMQSILNNHLDSLHQKEDRLQHMVQHDHLTNLPNRLMLFDRLRHAMDRASRSGHLVALIFIDLDRFKDINDSLGHAAGDEVIRHAATLLAHAIRGSDTIARLGGDEFVILVDEVENLSQVSALVQKLLKEVLRPVKIEGQDLYLSASMGVSLYPQDGRDAETLLRNADAAMYRSKADGRNMFHFYTEDLTQRALARVQMEADIRLALTEERFIPYYQPQIELATGRIIGVEALVRWNQGDGSLVMPGAFISLAEDTGLIEPIGETVLRQACQKAADWRKLGLDPGLMAVNLSGKQLRKADLTATILTILKETGCAPEWLELEVTESSFLDRPESAIEVLKELRQLGIKLAIDDFGTGYSSLTYLKYLPVTTLKIDRSFISHVPDDEDDVAITRAVIAMAKSLALRIIAEGVETQAQCDFVLAEGCDDAQGFLFSQAVPADVLKELLHKAPQRKKA